MCQELSLTLLGEPQVLRDGAPLTGFISAKSQAILIYLAATGRLHTRETLAALCWDEMPDAAAKKNLTKALSNLRKLIGAHIETRQSTATLVASPSLWVDLQHFQQVLDADLAVVDLQMFQRAVDLYQGDFLSGFLVRGAPLFEEWVLTERERLHQLAVESMLTLSKRFAAVNAHDKAIHYLGRLLALEPLHEGAHLQMMVSLAGSGQRGAALAHYAHIQKLWAEELGVEPGSALQACFQQLKRSGTPPPHNIPASLPMVGRNIEMSEITALFSQSACHLLTIVGPGGIGKTHLALHTAARYVEQATAETLGGRFSDGIYFVSLASVNSVETLLAALSKTLSFAFQQHEHPRQQLVNYLRHKEMLLILDNFEHLVSDRAKEASSSPRAFESAPSKNCVALIAEFLDAAPGLRVLATSRIRLNVKVEHIFHLGGMEFPPSERGESDASFDAPLNAAEDEAVSSETFSQLMTYGAVQLFLQSARRLRPDFELTVSNIGAVAEICQRVQGMPLGILLAASWITILSPNEILSELRSSLDLLETYESDVPSRQRSVRAAFDYTWQLLSPREQEIYKKLSFFRGDFSRQAAQQITGATLRELMTMVDKSLLSPSPAGRFALHGLLRQYGLEKLQALPELEKAVRKRHRHFFAERMAELKVQFKGEKQQFAQQETEADAENYRAAWQCAVEDGHVESLAQIVDGLCQFYAWRGRFQEGVVVARQSVNSLKGRLFTAAPTPHEDGDRAALLRLLIAMAIWQSQFSRNLGDVEEASSLLQESLQLLESKELARQDLRQERAFALFQFGESLRETDKALAKDYYTESLKLYRSVNDRWGAANVLTALGWLVQHGGGYNEARQLYQESLTIRQSIADQRGLASSLRAVGGIALYQGDFAQAEQLISESLRILQTLNDRVGAAASYGKLGETFIAMGKCQEAEQPLSQALEIYSDLGLETSAAFINAIRALSHLHRGDHDVAHELVEKTLRYFRHINSRRGVAYASLVLGWLLLGQGEHLEAEKHLRNALTLYEMLGQRDELGQTHALLGLLFHGRGDGGTAQRHLQMAQSIAEQIQAYMPRLLADAIQRSLEAAQPQKKYATRPGSQVGQPPLVSASRWFTNLPKLCLSPENEEAHGSKTPTPHR